MVAHWQPSFHVPADVRELAARVRLALFDVDGVLTDGTIYLDDEGRETKGFHVHDGHGLKMLRHAGIEIGIISARKSGALKHRAVELGIDHVLTNQMDKLNAACQLTQKLQLDLSQCCFTGDDVIDIPLLLESGLAVAANNANDIVKDVAHWITPRSGGNGAVRDVCDLILYAQSKSDDIISEYFHRSRA
jgi:3-deoxy-D-manno-octulosonate 8-phosphate phosphatase (KDO 8-P phosphatase)